jgi:hypothetical protein
MQTLLPVDDSTQDESEIEEFDEDEELEEELYDEEDAEEAENDGALFTDIPQAIKRPVIVAEIVRKEQYDLADDDLKAQFDKLSRFCPCCGFAHKRGTFCDLCTRNVVDRGDIPYYMSNGVRNSACVYAKRYKWHVLTDHSLIKRRHGRLYHIFSWRLAFIYEKTRIRDDHDRKYYAGVKVDNRALSITADPKFVPLPEYEPGKVVGLRKVLRVERVFTPSEIHFDPQRPQPGWRAAQYQEGAPAWYRTPKAMTADYTFFGHHVYVEYEPAQREMPAVLTSGVRLGCTDDSDDDLACAQVGDRLGSEFGPLVVDVTRCAKRDLMKLPALHSGVKRGGVTTVVRLELATIGDFDREILRGAIAARIADKARWGGEPKPVAVQTLQRFETMSLEELVADAPAEPDSYSEWGRYLRGYTSLASALADLACNRVICSDCGTRETSHRGPMPCGRVKLSDDDLDSEIIVPDQGPQLALF